MENSEWKTDINYRKDDEVTYSDVNYKCLKDHTSKADRNPRVEPTLWQNEGAINLLGDFEVKLVKPFLR